MNMQSSWQYDHTARKYVETDRPTLTVIGAVRVGSDAYVAIVNPDGEYVVNGQRVDISNVMPLPEDLGYGWRSALMKGRVGVVRWAIDSAPYEAKDVDALRELDATLYVD